ncbi:Pseudouridine-metabolizing bifunctional protein [Aureococcus anophagefferens]|uniref:Pseudouridine-metabolizing bifunctional protein n=1 Tax=Aureococcus anophagefferens TaxID=44056 RepID=A0ABR1FWR5_AURAN
MLRQTMMALRIRRALAAAPRRGISSGGVVCSAEVRAALDRRGPVVALESTIITHGMPYPRNLEVARAVEARVRAGGAVPATVAVLDGKLRVGLSDAELERVAVAGDRGAAVKCSRRDLADVASRSANDGALVGATTVAGTAVAAHLAGVEVFATGGIGGVSADLVELGRTPILVVCAGVKSILDVPKTLEVLETQGVAVIGYGTDDLAAFFAARSSDNNKINRAPLRYDDAAGVAGWLAKNAELGLASGAVLAVPNPAPMDGDAIDGAIAAALEAAAARGVSGKDATPFLLAKLEEVTGGASLEANVALVLNNNAARAALRSPS